MTLLNFQEKKIRKGKGSIKQHFRLKKICVGFISLLILYSLYWYVGAYRYFKKLPEGAYLKSPSSPCFIVKKPNFLLFNGEVKAIKEIGEFDLLRYEVLVTKPLFSDVMIEARTIDKPKKKLTQIKQVSRIKLSVRLQQLKRRLVCPEPYLDFMTKEMLAYYQLSP